jgi:hypothetical protein
MRALQPDNQQDRVATLCVPCVYYSKNLDPSIVPQTEHAQMPCGLGFSPGDGGCAEMRTNNCGMRTRKD